MRHSFLIDLDLEEILDEDFSDEEIELWFQAHKEEFVLNLYEHAQTEIKYFLRELYPLKN